MPRLMSPLTACLLLAAATLAVLPRATDSAALLYAQDDPALLADLAVDKKLSPPVAGQAAWNEAVVYSFKGGRDGANPRAGLLPGGAGSLFTTTSTGGAYGNGTVVQIVGSGFGTIAPSE